MYNAPKDSCTLCRRWHVNDFIYGFLVIAYISGYTAFLRDSELEHAEDSLRSLLNLLLDHTNAPLKVSRLQGDAVISYAPKHSFAQGQTLVEIMETTYAAIRQALERMTINTNFHLNEQVAGRLHFHLPNGYNIQA
jgi:hypothetical protein